MPQLRHFRCSTPCIHGQDGVTCQGRGKTCNTSPRAFLQISQIAFALLVEGRAGDLGEVHAPVVRP